MQTAMFDFVEVEMNDKAWLRFATTIAGEPSVAMTALNGTRMKQPLCVLSWAMILLTQVGHHGSSLFAHFDGIKLL